jgi:hypothetical protein
MRQLNLHVLDNYNRHDLGEGFLMNLVLNEFTDIRDLTVQNHDVGRIVAWLKVLDQFETHIATMKKINPALYANFIPKLKIIRQEKPTYRMETDKIAKFYRRYFFTYSTDLL